MLVAAAIMFLAMASYVTYGLLLLLDLGVFSRGLTGLSVVQGSLTTDGRRLVLAGFFLFFAVFALVVLVGFLLRRRWGWSGAMTWTALSLVLNLVAYFEGQPRYLSMLAGVVLLLVLNQASLHREFRLEER